MVEYERITVRVPLGFKEKIKRLEINIDEVARRALEEEIRRRETNEYK
jgi:post-segregation antitoxin (ccd killing protein)